MKREIFTEEHDIFRDAFKKFLEQEVVPHQEEWLEAGIVTRDIWKKTGEQGFIAPWLAEEYGGAGADFLYSVVEIEEMSRIAETGFALGLHGEVVMPYIDSFGNEEQKKRWLPGCASGDIITAVAMTEPNTGSDLQAIKMTATRSTRATINGCPPESGLGYITFPRVLMLTGFPTAWVSLASSIVRISTWSSELTQWAT